MSTELNKKAKTQQDIVLKIKVDPQTQLPLKIQKLPPALSDAYAKQQPVDIQKFLQACQEVVCLDKANQHRLLQEIIARQDRDLLKDYVKQQAIDLNQPDPVSHKTALEYALSVNKNYHIAETLVALGAKVTPSLFEMSPDAYIGSKVIPLAQKSAVTGQPLSWENRAALLMAGDMQQKFPSGKIAIAFDENVPVKLQEAVKLATAEYAKHAALEFNYIEKVAAADIKISYEPIPFNKMLLTLPLALTFPLPPSTSEIDLFNDTDEQVEIVINSSYYSLRNDKNADTALSHTIAHELAHGLLGGVHPHDLVKLSYSLALQPFIKNSVNALNSQDLTVLSYEDIGKYIKLVHPNDEDKIQMALKQKAISEKLGEQDFYSLVLEKLKLVVRDEAQLGYADTVIAIEKYGPNLSKVDQVVIHPLKEGLQSSHTLTNQGGIGILDAREIHHSAEFVMDDGFCPTIIGGSIYYNAYLSPMQGLLTGEGSATIHLGHHDQWVEIQGGPKTLIWDSGSDDTGFATHIIGFRPGVDKIIFHDVAQSSTFSDLTFQQEKNATFLKLSEIIDTQVDDLQHLFAKNADASKSSTIIFYQLEGDFVPEDFQFMAHTRDPFGCAAHSPRYAPHEVGIPEVFQAMPAEKGWFSFVTEFFTG